MYTVSGSISENPKPRGKHMNPSILVESKALGTLVRQRRRSQSLRIDDAASLLGVSVDLMSRFENGQGTVRLDKAMAILDGLGLGLVIVPKEHPWFREAGAPPPPSGPGSAP
jgi:transcriptional regulator with XRE-family HTH domain